MLHDPLYQAILSALDGHLDPLVFERAAVSLLRFDYPGIVPVTGGNDAGMDGAVPDWDGPTFPLVVTTAKDVRSNLRGSLQAFSTRGGTQRKAVFATSRALTPAMRRNLDSDAQAAGFTLLQVYDREAIAERLYRAPAWCNDLLGLEGPMPALSAIPPTRRPLLDLPLVGREATLAWLGGLDGDSVIVGQPGLGKTAVLRHLVREGEALFVVSDDATRIANEVREIQPKVLVVDDAHLQPDRLRTLRLLRDQTGACFRILAATWPGDDAVALELGAVGQAVHELTPLSKDELVEVVKGCGLTGPTELLREIVAQAEGRPGLAATLTRLCLTGGLDALVTGDALVKDVRATVTQLAGKEAVPLLAAIALSGDAGADLDKVRLALELSLVEAWRLVSDLAAGGIVSVRRGESQLAVVRPPRLRQALVRDVFFSSTAPLPVQPFLVGVADRSEMMGVLIGAKALGGNVPPELVTPRDSDSVSTWRHFAALGPAEARFALESRPDHVVELSHEGLHYEPRLYITALLGAATGDDRERHSASDHPLRRLGDWAVSASSIEEAISRHTAVWEVAIERLAAGEDQVTSVRGVAIALRPDVSIHELDPGGGRTLTLKGGVLRPGGLNQLLPFWRGLAASGPQLPERAWRYLLDVVEDWIVPGRHAIGATVSAECSDASRAGGREMLSDIARLASGQLGVMVRIRDLAVRADLDMLVPVDPDGAILFPPYPGVAGNYEEVLSAQLAPVQELAARWAAAQPARVARTLTLWRQSAYQAAERVWPDHSAALCQRIAEHVANPSEWASELLRCGAWPDTIAPFLSRAMATEPPALWLDLARAALSDPSSRAAVIAVFLSRSPFPDALTGEAVAVLAGFENWVDTEALRGNIPDERLESMLRLASPSVAAAAAIGMWQHDRAIPAALERPWRRAVLHAPWDEHWLYEFWLGELLKVTPALAHDWLRRNIEGGRSLWQVQYKERPPAGAVAGLDPDGRRCLLLLLRDEFGSEDLARALVGDDVEAFEALLASDAGAPTRLAPLNRARDTVWAEFVVVAVETGWSVDKVAAASVWGSDGWLGPASEHYQSRAMEYRALATHPHHRVREVANRLALGLESQAAAERLREREEEIRGW